MPMRRAKIVATIGPASNTKEMISKLIETGVNVCRINMSHGTYEAHSAVIKNIREASRESGYEVAILADLQGPKIRVDKLPEPLKLEEGSEWVIGASKLKDKYPEYAQNYIPTIYENLVADCHDGARILFDDGLLQAVAVNRDRDVYKIKVKIGGTLKSNKGINLPDCEVSAPAFTDKDREDLMFALKEGADYVALSFVRKKEDIMQVKTLLHTLKVNIPIISKIEKPQAIDNLDDILSVTDMIMVARGDMGVEVGNHLVPAIQKKIITECNNKGIPVITATQMLESMTENPTPTRAEASDVANAIWDGTDAVMLSGESASGKYPIETVRMMDQIVREAERTPKERPLLRHQDLSSVTASVMVAASMIAEKIGARRILSVTESGQSCLRITQFRPSIPVLGITNSIKVARRMCLYWGVSPFIVTDQERENNEFMKNVLKEVKDRLKLKNGDKLVVTRGDGQFFSQGSSNSVKVELIKDVPKVKGGSQGLEEASDDKKKILLDTNNCASCQACVQVCPHEIWAVTKDEKRDTYIEAKNINKCTMDLACVDACPTGAIEIIPQY
ncbi:pyruvate kinase [Bacteriovorax stolpii]|uniref:Pyruvate kinase n=2 Tax=Bacteriovorax stolpii TaxID=960 RepID=A0A2K9NQU3_BACTC|nr:pyruvate kinase [Bacteriovorax stolpii]QDK42136.1 pyruvate kinase [Bacteriovorax stolpii]